VFNRTPVPYLPALAEHLGYYRQESIAVTLDEAASGANHYLLNYLLSQKGLHPDDVHAVAIGAGPAAVAAVERRQIEACIVSLADYITLKRPGGRDDCAGRRRVRRRSSYCVQSRCIPEHQPPGHDGMAESELHNSCAAGPGDSAYGMMLHEHTTEEVYAVIPHQYRTPDKQADLETINTLRKMYSSDGIMTQAGAAAVQDMLWASIDKVKTANVNLRETYTNELVNTFGQ
jgi:NitT/TauT family transport system substrate-binding protein